MAYTVSQVVTRALKWLHAVAGGETASAEDSATGLENYNAMMFGFAADGLSLHNASDVSYAHAEQALGDLFPLHAKHFEGCAAVLATRMASEFPDDINPGLGGAARSGMNRLYADFLTIGEMTVSGALSRMPSHTAADFGE